MRNKLSRLIGQGHRLRTTICVIALVAVGCSDAADQGSVQPTDPGDDIGEELSVDLRELAAGLRLDDPPTDATFERFISHDDYGPVMVECLAGYGFQAEVMRDGGVQYAPVAQEQSLAQREAIFRCYVRYPVDPRFTAPPNAAQLAAIYDYLTGDLTECLRDLGFQPDPPPSREAFIDSMADPDAEPWHPYSTFVESLSIEEWWTVNEACPQGPDPSELLLLAE